MEAGPTDVSLIQDEDVLRRMWQQTEDFGRKKEIRTHMYRLREARLKEFYTSGEVLRDVQRSNSSPGLRQQHSKEPQWAAGPTHADSLADHSFLSLKSKEIRDSESPTRDVSYQNARNQGDNGNWTVITSNEKSDDGKTISKSRVAKTQGSQPVDGGVVNFSATNELKSTTYSDGDAKNFTKSFGESQRTVAHEDFSTDDSNRMKTQTSSSSHQSKVIHSSSSTDDYMDKNIGDSQVIRRVHSEIPEDFTDGKMKFTSETNTLNDGRTKITSETKTLPDGKTRVTTETKTLPDGSTVTTTRYETKGATKWSSSSSSSNAQVSNRFITEERSGKTDNKIEYIIGQDEYNNTVADNLIRDNNRDTRKVDNKTIESTTKNTKSDTRRVDDSITSSVNIIKSEQNVEHVVNKNKTQNENKDIVDHCKVTHRSENIRENKLHDVDNVNKQDGTQNITTKVTREEYHIPPADSDYTETKTTVTKSTDITKRSDDTVITEKVPRPQDMDTSKQTRPRKDDTPYKPSTPTSDQYSTTYRQEFTNKRVSVDVSPTHDAFARSLRAVSPDHGQERPKSGSPTRGSTRSLRTSNSSLRSSTSPEKSPKCIPDDRRQPTRVSPERRYSADRYQETRETRRTDTVKNVRRFSPERRSPKKSPSPDSASKTFHQTPDRKSPKSHDLVSVTTTRTVNIPDTPYSTDTITRKKKPRPSDESEPVEIHPDFNSDTITRKKRPTSPSKSPDKNTTTFKTIDTSVITDTARVRKHQDTRKNSTDTFTRKSTPSPRTSPVRSPTKAKDFISIEKAEMIRQRKSPERPTNSPADTPRSRTPSPTKVPDKKSPIKSTKLPDEKRPRSPEKPIKKSTIPDRDIRSPTKEVHTSFSSTTVSRRGHPDNVNDVKYKKPSSRDTSPVDIEDDRSPIKNEQGPHNLSDTTVSRKAYTDTILPYHTVSMKPNSRDSSPVRQEKPTEPPKESLTKPEETTPHHFASMTVSRKAYTDTIHHPSSKELKSRDASPVGRDEQPEPSKEAHKPIKPQETSPHHFASVTVSRKAYTDTIHHPSSKELKSRDVSPVGRDEQPEPSKEGHRPIKPEETSPHHFASMTVSRKAYTDTIHHPSSKQPNSRDASPVGHDDQPEPTEEGHSPTKPEEISPHHFASMTVSRKAYTDSVHHPSSKTPSRDTSPVGHNDLPKSTTEINSSATFDSSTIKKNKTTRKEVVVETCDLKPKRQPARDNSPDDIETKRPKNIDSSTLTKTTNVRKTDVQEPKLKRPSLKESPVDDVERQRNINTSTVTRKSSTKKTETIRQARPTSRDISPVGDDRKRPSKKGPKSSKPSTRDSSPTSSASDIEFIAHNSHIVTDLDAEDINISVTKNTSTVVTREDRKPSAPRPTSLEIKPMKEDDALVDKSKSPTKRKSPVKDDIPKQVPKKSSLKNTPTNTEPLSPSEQPPTEFLVSPDIEDRPVTKQPTESKEKPPFRRSETYEERCRKILGMPEPKQFPNEETKITATTYMDLYAGKEPVEEPMFTKKRISLLGPSSDDTDQDEPIQKAPRESPKLTKKKSSPQYSPDSKRPNRFTPSPERKTVRKPSFEEPKQKQKKITSDQEIITKDEYITEYTDEYCTRETPRNSVETTLSRPKHETDKTKKIPSAVRKTPSKTEIVREIAEKPNKLDSNREAPEPKKEIPSRVTSRTEISDGHTSRLISPKKLTEQTPEKKQPISEPKKDSPRNVSNRTVIVTNISDDYNSKITSSKRPVEQPISEPKKDSPRKVINRTEIVAEISNDYSKITPPRKPVDQTPEKKQQNPVPETKVSPRNVTSRTEIVTNVSDVRSLNKSSPRKPTEASPERKQQKSIPNAKKERPSKVVNRTELIAEISNDNTSSKTSPRKPMQQTPDKNQEKPVKKEMTKTEIVREIYDYCNDNGKRSPEYQPRATLESVTLEDFLMTEKHDTDITLSMEKPEISIVVPKETRIPKGPSKVLTEKEFDEINIEIELTQEPVLRIKKIDTVVSDKKKPIQPTKQKIGKNINLKKTDDVKTTEKFPKENPKQTPTRIQTTIETRVVPKKAPIRTVPKQRSPSPDVTRTTKRVDNELHIETTHMGSKSPTRDIPTRVQPKKGLDSPRRPQDICPSRKPLYTSPAPSPERKPISKVPSKISSKPKDGTPMKNTDAVKKHIVTKTISLTKVKPEASKPSRVPSKTVTQIKPQKVTNVTKTTKTTKKVIKKFDSDASETDSEPEIYEDNLETDTRKSSKITISENTEQRKLVGPADIKITRTTSDYVMKPKHKSPIRGKSKPEIVLETKTLDKIDSVTKETDRITNNVLTTKSIVVNQNLTTEEHGIVDLLRSKSSRESSPEKICPMPISSEEETEYPRYPDQISEPDDIHVSKRRPEKVRDIPLTEGADVTEFNRITDITDDTLLTDESLLSVTEKVTRFMNTAEELTNQKPKAPSQKVPRPELIVTEDMREDECLLSVSQKVSKFINTAEQLTTSKKETDKNTVRDFINNEVDVNEKVSRFTNVTDDTPSYPHEPKPKVARPEITNVDEHLRTDECLLSVSDKVSKFLTTAEKLAQPKSSPKSEPKEKVPQRIQEPVEPKQESRFDKPKYLESEESDDEPEVLESQRVPKLSIQNGHGPKEPYITPKYTSQKVHEPVEHKPVHKLPQKQEAEPKIYRKVSEPFEPKQEPKLPSQKITHEAPKKIQEPDEPKQVTRRDSDTSKKSPLRSRISLDSMELRPKSEPTLENRNINLKSSEAVRKAKAMFENISQTQSSPKQRDILSRPSVWEGRKATQSKPKEREPSPIKDSSADVKLTDIGVYKKNGIEVKKQLTYTTNEDDVCYRKPDNSDLTLKSTRLIMTEKVTDQQTSRASPEKEMPGYMKPLSHKTNQVTHETEVKTRAVTKPKHSSPEREQPKPVALSPIDHENGEPKSKSPEKEMPGYMRPLIKHEETVETRSRYKSRQSPEPSKPKEEPDSRNRISPKTEPDTRVRMSPRPKYVSPEREMSSRTKVTTQEKHEEVHTKVKTSPKVKDPSPETNVPGYMKPLQRQISEDDKNVEDNDAPRAGKKFGVTLRRTDSGRTVIVNSTTTTLVERRRSSTTSNSGQPVIEDILDVDLLEQMMEKAVGYEQRRRIRAQIRIVRRLISEHKIIYTPNKNIHSKPTTHTNYTDRKSPTKQTKPAKDPETETCQCPHEPITIERIQKRRDSSIETFEAQETTEYQSAYVTTETKSQTKVLKKAEPQVTQSVFKTDLKRTQSTSKSANEDKPSWVTERKLKKTTETTSQDTTTKKFSQTPKKKETPVRRQSPFKDVKPTDVITSSYGIGPTDENGQPLFGIRALRKAATEQVHVSGTVISSQFYSENGQEPVGEVSVTKYSTDPQELGCEDEEITKSKGFASVTTTQKFGSRGTPNLKAIADKKKSSSDLQSEQTETRKTTNTKVTRRGSVKALSQKFIENAVETSKNERQIYPKAGLILRTSSFKDTLHGSDNLLDQECVQDFQAASEVSMDTVTSSEHRTSSRTSGETFLNSHTRVSNAQEIITRMKNSETEEHEGDTAEDREARTLLNKFLGAQVLMSGMEPLLGGPASASLVRKVQKTTTKETGKPTVTTTKRFQTPITAKLLEDIWDEQPLRLLLEQCTDYEERRIIRERLRQIMAEQEACANVVARAVAGERDADDDRTSVQERVETTKKTITEGPVKTTQVSTTQVSSTIRQVSKPMSPFAKFRQLDKQNSLNSPPSSPRTPGSGAPLFKFTDPALVQSASTVKDRLLQWCQFKTKEYQNIKLDNFSTSWADGLAFCALIHHFLPEAFDYHALNPQQRRHNFTLAFKVADEQAGIAPLLDVDDMVAMRRPDWKCVFTYVQSIYRRFKDED